MDLKKEFLLRNSFLFFFLFSILLLFFHPFRLLCHLKFLSFFLSFFLPVWYVEELEFFITENRIGKMYKIGRDWSYSLGINLFRIVRNPGLTPMHSYWYNTVLDGKKSEWVSTGKIYSPLSTLPIMKKDDKIRFILLILLF